MSVITIRAAFRYQLAVRPPVRATASQVREWLEYWLNMRDDMPAAMQLPHLSNPLRNVVLAPGMVEIVED